MNPDSGAGGEVVPAGDPTLDLAARVARLEAHDQIRLLAARYATAIDARDLDALVALYVPDVRAGGGAIGRDALRSEFEAATRSFTTSIHLTANHVVDLDDDDHAHGTVYCRAEHEMGDSWFVVALLYQDRYERRDGRWLFTCRRIRTWYGVDVLDRPVGDDRFRWPGRTPTAADLPEAYPSWQAFWAGDEDRRA